MDVRRAEAAVHARAFTAAVSSRLGVRCADHDGLLVVLTDSPGLTFLCAVTGVDETTVDRLPDVLSAAARAGLPAPVVVTSGRSRAVDDRLQSWGLVPAGRRPIAVRVLGTRCPPPAAEAGGAGPRVREARTRQERGVFMDVLVTGYEVGPEVAGWIRADHSAPSVRAFTAWQGDSPVAAAAMTVQNGVAVLGGAATVPGHRGSGGQRALLSRRLTEAQTAGADLATATAAPGSVSLRNLERTGFEVLERQAWRQPRWTCRS